MSTLVIGCGNLWRGDDAVGCLVARALREAGLEAVEWSGDPLALMDMWHGAGHVILVDAVVTGARPGRIHEWDAVNRPLPPEAFPSSTHACGVREAVELARLMRRLPDRLTVYGVEAAQFEPGAPASPAVARAASRLTRRIALGMPRKNSVGRAGDSGAT